MITVRIDIQNLDKLRGNFAKAPTTALKWLRKATEAAIFEVEKEAVDRNFLFKLPRAKRTGDLQKSFQYGRYIAPGGLQASIGPTVHYAPHVYFGTSRRLKPNPYMDRIAEAATPEINRHFETAVEKFVDELANV